MCYVVETITDKDRIAELCGKMDDIEDVLILYRIKHFGFEGENYDT